MKPIPLYLSCLLTVVVTGLEFRQYCYDPPGLSCAEQHILDCDEGQVITTDKDASRVVFLKNQNFQGCQTEKDECKNKTSCCQLIKDKGHEQEVVLFSDDTIPLIKSIKTECSSKSSCLVSSYYNSRGSPDLYDYVNYNYGCINTEKDEITVDFLVNGSTKFTGNRFPTVYYLDYTGNEKIENVVILNRECIVTTTERDITLTIKTLNLQADECCLFYISGHNVSEYCSQSGSFKPLKGKYINKYTATIRLENVVNKDGDRFSIVVKAAGNVNIDCRTIEHVDKQEPTNCQYPTPESSTTSITTSSTSPTTGKDRGEESITKQLGMENQQANYSESNLGAIIGGTVGGLVFLNIIFIVIVVLIVRRKLRAKQTTDEIQHYSSLDGLSNSPEHNYVGMETTSPTRA